MKNLKLLILLSTLLIIIQQTSFSQGFLHRDGRYIYDGAGNEVILRGIGTGNWMIQEGYMMQTSGVAGTQHEFRNKLINTIGVEKTDSFYTAWLHSHFRRIDVDSMKSWGFNSVRVAMHYKWFTLPIEDEPVTGENTWLETGFNLLDSLLDWCSDNQMYLILDMHGAPGGQGKNADISDYDPSKPSLWESQANRDKLVVLWKKLAERYSDEPWIGGYDLINETNWTFSNGNIPLWNLFKDITTAVREVDSNHLIILEGNGFANDYTGLPAIWDDNMMLSFHKYWTYNDDGSLDWMINLRNSRNIPIWLGESGENSNNWFTSLIELCERKHVGWSWWPVKKPSINNVLNVTVNEDYTRLVNYWKGSASNPGEEAAFAAVLQFAENHKLENCTYQKDVVDAMMRQPFTTETIPYKVFKTGEPVFASDYNLGRNGYAYFDNDTANFNGSTGEYINWNQGWSYRNDGVDIEACTDGAGNNGYSVGWTGDGEWMEYTLNVDSTASYSLDIRSASGSGGSKVHLESDGKIITSAINLPATSGWYNWKTTSVSEVILEKGMHKIKFVFVQGGSNLNYFQFSNPVAINSLPFNYLSAVSSETGETIFLTLNKPVTSDLKDVLPSEFEVAINTNPVEISDIILSETDSTKIEIHLAEKLYYGGVIRLSYMGNSILNGEQSLETFSDVLVENKLPVRYTVPRRIQSEDFWYNNGMVSESCDDTGGGYDMGYANPGDYMDYLVYVPDSGNYDFNFRIASERSSSQIIIRIGEENSFTSVDTITITGTGGWQTWKTISSGAVLPEGRYMFRVYVRSGEFNTNWFEIKKGTAVGIEDQKTGDFKLYPNPADTYFSIQLPESYASSEITVYNIAGQPVKVVKPNNQNNVRIDSSDLAKGLYNVVISNGRNIISQKLIIR